MQRTTGKTKGLKRTRKIPKPPSAFASTGSTELDCALGGGFAFGRVVNIVGDNSSGKSLVSTETIAQAKARLGKKLKWKYDDAEAGHTFDTKKMYGFDLFSKKEKHSRTVEGFQRRFKKFLHGLKGDEFGIYVLDSVDRLSSDSEIKGDSAMLMKQRLLNRFFRIFIDDIKTKNVLLILVSQVRQNIGVMFGDKYTRTGGKALDFYCSQIVWLSETEKFRLKDRVYGIAVRAKVKKNKIGKPFREAMFEILFDYGVDDISSCVKCKYDLRSKRGLTKKSKEEKTPRLKWDGQTFKSVPALVKYIEDNDQEAMLQDDVRNEWYRIERSISSEGRKRKYV